MSALGLTGLEGPLVFVDIETNGLNHIRGRIIEVAAIRVHKGKVVQTFSSLIDPEAELPYYITNLTGITDQQLKGAPTFDQIADELAGLMEGAIFVAHNVRFDYSFLKQEFGRLGLPFLPQQLCTVKLSRSLYPKEKGHKLADLISRHGFTFAQRHRAYDDAAILWQFIQHLQKHFSAEQLIQAVRQQIRQPALPKSLSPELIGGLPETTGVYIFEDEKGRPLYIGKSVNIKQRVLAHFGRDHIENKEFKIAQSINHIRVEQTAGELAALLLESRLIKELQPVYNRKLRYHQQVILARRETDAAGYQRVSLETVNTILPEQLSTTLAVFSRRSQARQVLEQAARDYDLCPKLMGLEKAPAACFLRQLKKCRGSCVGREKASIYNRRLEIAFERQRIQSWPFGGAILLEEKTAAAKSQALIVDQWCVLGEITQEPHCDPLITTTQRNFDLDTYKILRSFIATKLERLTIRRLPPQQLAVLQAS